MTESPTGAATPAPPAFEAALRELDDVVQLSLIHISEPTRPY